VSNTEASIGTGNQIGHHWWMHLAISSVLAYGWAVRCVPIALLVYPYTVIVGLAISRSRAPIEKLLSVYWCLSWVQYTYVYLFQMGDINTGYLHAPPLSVLLTKDVAFLLLALILTLGYKKRGYVLGAYLLGLAFVAPHFFVKSPFYVVKNEYLDTLQFLVLLFLVRDKAELRPLYVESIIAMGALVSIGGVLQVLVGSHGPAYAQGMMKAVSTLGTSLTFGPLMVLLFWAGVERYRHAESLAYPGIVLVLAFAGLLASVSLAAIVGWVMSMIAISMLLYASVCMTGLLSKRAACGLGVGVLAGIAVAQVFAGSTLTRIAALAGDVSVRIHVGQFLSPPQIRVPQLLLGIGPEVYLESGYLTLLYDFGLPALVVVVAILIVAAWRSARNALESRFLLELGFLIAILVGMFPMKYLSMFPVNMHIMMILGMALSHGRRKWRKTQSE